MPQKLEFAGKGLHFRRSLAEPFSRGRGRRCAFGVSGEVSALHGIQNYLQVDSSFCLKQFVKNFLEHQSFILKRQQENSDLSIKLLQYYCYLEIPLKIANQRLSIHIFQRGRKSEGKKEKSLLLLQVSLPVKGSLSERSLYCAFYQSQLMMKTVEQSPPIIDRYFLGSLLKLNEDLKSNAFLIATRTALIILMIILNHYVLISNTEDAKQALTIYLFLILIQNVLQLSRDLYFYFKKFKNKTEVLKVAQHFNHCLYLDDLVKEAFHDELTEELLFFETEAIWGLRVSRCYYNFENMKKMIETTEEQRTASQQMGNHSIKVTLETSLLCYRFLGYILGTISAFLLIYGAVLNFKVPLSQFQSTFVEFYIISQIVLNTKTFVILLIIVMIPFVLVVLAIYAIFFRRYKKVNFPEVVKMTPEHMSKCSDCSICFQTFVEEEKVIILKCSELHIFHETCIKGWGKIKANCPICRQGIE